MIRGWIQALSWLALPLLGCLTALAQAPIPTQPIVAIDVQPAPTRTAKDYSKRITQPLGQPPDPERIRESIQALYQTGDFADVKAIAYAAPGGLRLEFATTPNYFVGVVRMQGTPDPPTSSELEDASGLELGKRYTPDLLNQAVDRVYERLREYGYFQATLTPKAVPDPDSAQVAIMIALHAGPRVRTGTVTFTGDTQFPADQLLQASGLKAGKPLTHETLDNAIRKLQTLYGKSDRLTALVHLASQQYQAATNSLDVVFDVQAGPLVAVKVEGYHMSQGALEKRVPIFEEHAADAALIEEGRKNLADYLQGKGYYQASVNFRRTQAANGELQIVYVIDAGPKESLDSVRFEGNRYFTREDLLEHVAIHVGPSFLPDYVPGVRGRFSDELTQGDADAIAALYHANGFEGVQVKPDVIRDFKGKTGKLGVVFRITEGSQTLVRNVRLLGLKTFTTAQIQPLLTTAPNQPFGNIAVAADRDSILTYYADHGFEQAACDSETTRVAGTNRVDVTFTIVEGPQQTVNQLFIAGQERVRLGVIRDRLEVDSGKPLSQVAVLNSQRRLYDLGLFTDVNVALQNPTGEETSKNVLVTVNEARRYTFSEGVGVQIQGGTGNAGQPGNVLGNVGISPLLSLGVTRIAVTGRQQSISIKGAYGTLEKRVVLNYDLPNFNNDSNLKLDVTTFYDDSFDVRTFRSIREQGGVQLEQTLRRDEGLTYNLEYRFVRVLDPQVAPEEIPVLSQPVQEIIAAVTYHRDRRDDPLNSHRGTYNTVQSGLAKSYGAANFGRIYAQNAQYFSFGSLVLARSTQFGFIIPFGRSDTVSITDPVTGAITTSEQHIVPLPERFLSGGPYSLRGFSLNQAGPRDPITGFPVGGNAVFINNLELRFPLIGSNIGGVIFYDLGNVYTSPRTMLDSLLRFAPSSPTNLNYTSNAVGAGLRYITPVGPIRIGAGALVKPPTFQYFSSPTAPAQVILQKLPGIRFFFSIGQTF